MRTISFIIFFCGCSIVQLLTLATSLSIFMFTFTKLSYEQMKKNPIFHCNTIAQWKFFPFYGWIDSILIIHTYLSISLSFNGKPKWKFPFTKSIWILWFYSKSWKPNQRINFIFFFFFFSLIDKMINVNIWRKSCVWRIISIKLINQMKMLDECRGKKKIQNLMSNTYSFR